MTRGLAKPAQARALMIAVATLGLLLVTFLVLSHDQRARAAFPGENGRIAFDSNRDGDFEIFKMHDDGNRQRQLTDNTANDYGAAFSPSGKRIAFRNEPRWRLRDLRDEGGRLGRAQREPEPRSRKRARVLTQRQTDRFRQ